MGAPLAPHTGVKHLTPSNRTPQPSTPTRVAKPFASPIEHLDEHIKRISDLVGAHLARRPSSSGGRRRIDRDELLLRSELRSLGSIPEAARLLLKTAENRAVGIEARERATLAAGIRLPLVELVERFGLRPEERDALLLVVAPVLDPHFAEEWEAIEHTVRNPDVGFLLSVLSRSLEETVALRRIFAIDAPLIANSLLLGAGGTASESDFLHLTLEAPRRIVNELLGDASLDEELLSFSRVQRPLATLDQVVLPEETKALVTSIVEHHGDWVARRADWGIDEVIPYGRGLNLLFSGPPGTGKTMLANAVAGALGKRLFVVDAEKLGDSRSLESSLDAIFREVKLLDAVLFFDEAEQIFTSRRLGNTAMPLLLTRLERFDGIAILATNMAERLDEALDRRLLAHVDFRAPTASARELIWKRHLPARTPLAADVDLERLAREYELTGGLIKNAVLAGVLHAVTRGSDALSMEDLAHGARLQVRFAQDETGRLVKPTLGLDDVVLPAEARGRIDAFVDAVRVRRTVLQEWGFERTMGRGNTSVALLSGPSGTGKSMTAEAIASALDRPLLRASLPGILSKYVGETSSRLHGLFEQAKASRAVLVFDEADALFARRVSVQSSTDRYANADTATLLSILDEYDDVVVLTTNSSPDIDPAFARRFHLRLDYERPNVATRRRIWKKLIPADAPLATDVELGQLARAYELTGGDIRNAVLEAALEAAGRPAGERVITHAMLDRAARAQLVGAPGEPLPTPSGGGPIGLA